MDSDWDLKNLNCCKIPLTFQNWPIRLSCLPICLSHGAFGAAGALPWCPWCPCLAWPHHLGTSLRTDTDGYHWSIAMGPLVDENKSSPDPMGPIIDRSPSYPLHISFMCAHVNPPTPQPLARSGLQCLDRRLWLSLQRFPGLKAWKHLKALAQQQGFHRFPTALRFSSGITTSSHGSLVAMAPWAWLANGDTAHKSLLWRWYYIDDINHTNDIMYNEYYIYMYILWSKCCCHTPRKSTTGIFFWRVFACNCRGQQIIFLTAVCFPMLYSGQGGEDGWSRKACFPMILPLTGKVMKLSAFRWPLQR